MDSGSKTETPANIFLALPPPYTDPDLAAFWVVPVPFERTTSYQKGTALGPAAILAASAQVEFHDEELDSQPARAGIHTTAPFPVDREGEEFCKALATACGAWWKEGRVIALLGGEHTISIGPVRALSRRYPGMGVLHIDAHADLRNSYEGSLYNHACTARRLLEISPLVQVGVRAISTPEARFLRETDRVKTFMVQDSHANLPGRVCDALPETVYITLDIDGLDPSVAPGTGTPQPGGLGYREVLHLLREVCQRKTVVGMDLVEVRPLPGNAMTEFLAARLLYKMMGYIATRGGACTPAWPCISSGASG